MVPEVKSKEDVGRVSTTMDGDCHAQLHFMPFLCVIPNHGNCVSKERAAPD
jgi:hypothetical protein